MRIIKGFFRFLSVANLVAAVFVGVLDSVRSVATQAIDMVSTFDALLNYWPDGLDALRNTIVHYIHPEAWRSTMGAMEATPVVFALLAIALVFWLVGYAKERARPQVFAALV